MRLTIVHQSIAFSIHTERPFTCALFGQLDPKAGEPKRFALVGKSESGKQLVRPEDEDFPEIAEHARRLGNGWFGMGPLDWFETPEEADKAKEKWPDRINMTVLPVQITVENG